MASPVEIAGRKCVKCGAENPELAYIDGGARLGSIKWVCGEHSSELEAAGFDPQGVVPFCQGLGGTCGEYATHVGTKGDAIVPSCPKHLANLGPRIARLGPLGG